MSMVSSSVRCSSTTVTRTGSPGTSARQISTGLVPCAPDDRLVDVDAVVAAVEMASPPGRTSAPQSCRWVAVEDVGVHGSLSGVRVQGFTRFARDARCLSSAGPVFGFLDRVDGMPLSPGISTFGSRTCWDGAGGRSDGRTAT
jgi:hypothetical protein